MQKIAVIGAGNIGGTIGRKWLAAGYPVTFGVHSQTSEKTAGLKAAVGGQTALVSPADALRQAEIVLLAIPGASMPSFIQENGALLDGKIVIDAANRLGGRGPADSFAELRQYAPKSRRYRAFNNLGWENFANPVIGGMQVDLFYCGPEGSDRQAVEELIRAVGLNPVWLGGEDQVGVVDSILSLWLTLVKQGQGRHLAFKVLKDAAGSR